LAADHQSAFAFINTQVATGSALLGWIFVEWIRDGKPTALGGASGAVAGLVAITPACATIEPMGAIALGLVAGAVCALAVGLKYKFGFDDSLDVVGVHLVGGATGALLIGLLATTLAPGIEAITDGKIVGSSSTGGVNGLFYGGGFAQLGRQAVAVVAVGLYSFVLAWLIGKLIDKTIGFRLTADDEVAGIDAAEHAESAYDDSPGSGGATGAFDLAGVGATKPAANGPAAAPDDTETETVKAA